MANIKKPSVIKATSRPTSPNVRPKKNEKRCRTIDRCGIDFWAVPEGFGDPVWSQDGAQDGPQGAQEVPERPRSVFNTLLARAWRTSLNPTRNRSQIRSNALAVLHRCCAGWFGAVQISYLKRARKSVKNSFEKPRKIATPGVGEIFL